MITYCTLSWPSLYPCKHVDFFSCIFLRGQGGDSREVLITASYQVTCKCIITPNFLMCIASPRSCSASVGRRRGCGTKAVCKLPHR